MREATRPAPACPQPRGTFGSAGGAQCEDCLRLDVWTPAGAVPATFPREGLPVLFWIHGGGFATGSASRHAYDGTSLARRGAVVVCANYRLGILGFLAHPALSSESDQGISGNYGLLDQIAALRWVRENIAAFGGDPGRVTIFGESAGAVSAMCLRVMPAARGLFHRAIAQSATLFGRLRRLREPLRGLESAERAGRRIAASLGGGSDEGRRDDGGGERILPLLRSRDAAALVSAARPALGLFARGIVFGPVIDGVALPGDPLRMLEEGLTPPMPLLVGSNADEGSIFLPSLRVRTPPAYQAFLRRVFRDRAAQVEALFPAPTPATVRDALNHVLTVFSFVAQARALARAAARRGTPAYLYHFTRKGSGTAGAGWLGAFHSAEIPYVFGTLGARASRNPTDTALSRAMGDAWVRFASCGNPNGEDGSPHPVPWPPHDPATDAHLEFGASIRVATGLHREACAIFDAMWKERRAAQPRGRLCHPARREGKSPPPHAASRPRA